MGVVFHTELVQGTQAWIDARKGILTASEMSRIISPKLKLAANDKQRAHVFELAAQRITGHVAPSYEGDDIMRGHEDEIDARDLYRQHYHDVDEIGFITNDKWGFTIGYSPDGLVADEGQIEAKSRKQHFQVQTIAMDEVPDDHIIQVQTGLLVSERKWCDYISFSGGMPMAVIRAYPDPEIHEHIIKAATAFELSVLGVVESYKANVAKYGYHPTERRVEREIML